MLREKRVVSKKFYGLNYVFLIFENKTDRIYMYQESNYIFFKKLKTK